VRKITGIALGALFALLAAATIFTYIGVIWAAIYALVICHTNGIGGTGCP